MPEYPPEPLKLARWGTEVVLKPHQVSAVRRMMALRRGGIYFDVGVGKTYTGIGILCAARQQGWAKRPIIVVPLSLAWQWHKHIKKALPDYRVAVIGSVRTLVKGVWKSRTDTPEERAAKWTRFMAGGYDVVILTLPSLARTRLNEQSVRAYAEATAAIQRDLILRKRNAKRRGNLMTPRQRALVNEGVKAWIAEKLELKGKSYDPGITWDDIACDLLIIDEWQNFKNLFLPAAREGGVPKYIGNPGPGSDRAWNLEFRAAAVRARSGGAGVVELSGTPAKNGPGELFNALWMIDPDAFRRIGITDFEGFLSRFCRFEAKFCFKGLKLEMRAACTGFQNLQDLRALMDRYTLTRTAAQVGLKLPEPEVRQVPVTLDERQEARYAVLNARLERLLTKKRVGHAALGIQMRLALVAVHADLEGRVVGGDDALAHGAGDAEETESAPSDDASAEAAGAAQPGEDATGSGGDDDAGGGAGLDPEDLEEEDEALPPEPKRVPYTWLDAETVPDPSSAKFTALAKEIVARPGCGHIVFLDNVAAHKWVKMVLVGVGVPAERIAILNAKSAKGALERQQIAAKFNGDPEQGIAPSSTCSSRTRSRTRASTSRRARARSITSTSRGSRPRSGSATAARGARATSTTRSRSSITSRSAARTVPATT